MDELRSQLEMKLGKILRVYVFAQEAYLYTEYFHNPETKEELELVTNSPHRNHLSMIKHMLFRTLIIEVSKLFRPSKNDKFQLEGLINSLSSGYYNEIGISTAHIETWKQLLADNELTVRHILILRDKLYAHTDDPMRNYDVIALPFEQIKTLLDLAGQILISIYGDIFDKDLILDSPTFDREGFAILKLLAKAERERRGALFNTHRDFKK